MRRFTLPILFLSLLAAFLSGKCVVYAAEAEDIIDEFNSIVPDGVGVDISDTGAGYLGIDMIFEEIIHSFDGRESEISAFFLSLFGFSILVCVSSQGTGTEGRGLSKSVSVSVLTLASVSIFSSLLPLFESLRESLSSLVSFFSAAIPVLTGVSTLLAEAATAGVQAMNMSITLAIIEGFSVNILMPVSFALFALSFIGGISESGGIASLARGIKGAFMWGVGIVSMVIAAIISIQSVVASAHDSAVLRAARYAASGAIPIVGTTVASALGTLGGGLAFIKSSVGAASIAVILSITLSPLVILLLYRLAFSLCTSFLEFCSAAEGVRCFSALRGALDAVIAVYSMSALVCIVELVVFLKGGAAAF